MSFERERGEKGKESPVGQRILHTRGAEEANRLINERYEQAKALEKSGAPVAWLYYGPPHEILQCFGVLDLYPENFGAACAMKGTTSPYMEYGEELGLSTNTCTYLRISLGYSRALLAGERDPNLPYGGLAKPTMLMTGSRHCDPRIKIFDLNRRYFDVPVFMYDWQAPPNEDPRVNDRNACKHYIDHFVDGLKEMIAFLEKETGKKLDRKQLDEQTRNSIEMWQLYSDIQELRKNVPCPLPSGDHFVVGRPYLDMTGEAKGVEFYRKLRRELEERIRAGTAAATKEKYRILWLGLPPWTDLEIFNYLESLGVVSVVETAMHPSKYHEVDLSDPLRALAEKYLWGWDIGGSDGSLVRCGSYTAGNHIVELAKEYKVDGVIANCVISCRAVSIGHKHTARYLRDTIGLPVLYFESDMSDPRSYSKVGMREKVDGFVHLLESKK